MNKKENTHVISFSGVHEIRTNKYTNVITKDKLVIIIIIMNSYDVIVLIIETLHKRTALSDD